MKITAIFLEMTDNEGHIWGTDFYGANASAEALREVKACKKNRGWKLYHATPVWEKNNK